LRARSAARAVGDERVRSAAQVLDHELAVGPGEHRRADLAAVPGLLVLAAVAVNRDPRVGGRLAIGVDHVAADHAVARLERQLDAGLLLALRELERRWPLVLLAIRLPAIAVAPARGDLDLAGIETDHLERAVGGGR